MATTKTPKLTRTKLLQEISYEDACTLWSKADYWSLDDAVDLWFGHKPRFFGPVTYDAQTKIQRDAVYQLGLNSLGEHLPWIFNAGHPEPYRVRPHEFLDWARSRFTVRAPELLDISHEATQAYKRGTARKPMPDQRHRERCRALAALLWQENPTLTKVEMAQRRELQEFGCEGTVYAGKTVEGWIKDLNPNPKPGRRPGH